MKKLSEVSSDTLLIIECDECDTLMDKQEYLESRYATDEEDHLIYLAEIEEAEEFSFSDLIFQQSEEMHEDWQERVEEIISKEDWQVLKRAETIINKAFEANPSYSAGEFVDKDI